MKKTIAITTFAMAHPVFAEGNYGGALVEFLIYSIAIVIGILLFVGIKISASSDKSYARTNIFLLVLVIVIFALIMFFGI